MLQLTIDKKHRIHGDNLTLELLFNNLSGLGFDAEKEDWQIEFNRYLSRVSHLLRLKLDRSTPISLTVVESGQVLEVSTIGQQLKH